MPGFADTLRETYARLTPRQRMQVVLGVAAAAALVWGASAWATKVRYGVLFSNLAPEDAAPVVASLRTKQVPYRVGPGGSAVEVPAEKVDELRLELAGEGLPRSGGVGFEIFDKPAFGLSDFVQNVNYRRALEREVARTIQSLDVVESARVHLALPPESLFAGDRREPSASVVLRLRSGRALSPNQVGAVQHLVASGVEGLEPGRVSVIDGHGRMLSDGAPLDEGAAGLSASQLETKRSLEASIETTLVGLLEPVVGPGRIRARATAELNLSRTEKVEESWDPDRAVVRSEQKSRVKSASASGGGIPGTASNLPTGNPVAAAGGASGTQSESETLNYEISKVVARIAEPAGGIRRLSVAVVVDHAIVESKDADGAVEKKSVPRSEEEMRKISDLVRAAAGIREDRGDVLIVESAPFDPATAPGADGEPVGPSPWWPLVSQALRIAAYPLAGIFLFFFVIRPALAAVRSLRDGAAPAGGGIPTVAQLQASLAPSGGEDRGMIALRRQLVEAAAQNPEAAALILRRWIASEKER